MANAGSPSPSPPPPRSELHNASFSLSRLTPLYAFNSSRLDRYAHEFRDIVCGDVIRGVNVNANIHGLETTKASLLRSCEWTLENGLLPTVEFQSVVIKISWDDGSTYTAILLPDFTSSEAQTTLGKRKRGSSSGDRDFTLMPLLLTRGFPPVTRQLRAYLTTRFDSRVSDVRLPQTLLGECLQGYLELLFKESQRVINSRLKILELTFSTPEPTACKVKGALRKIVLSVDAADVQELCGR
jgi:hypothetical protein